MKVVGSTVIGARAGMEFLDTSTGELAAHHWTRGSCYFGVLPASGRLYVPPHDCACYVRAKLSGFLAMNSQKPLRSAAIPEDRRLERGPTYGQSAANAADTASEDWPTYRHNMTRRRGLRTASWLATAVRRKADCAGGFRQPRLCGVDRCSQPPRVGCHHRPAPVASNFRRPN
jgi:hypothetical protein